ncbi:MAG: N-acetylgalactosamine-6-sulfatase [Opitutaceae bacterium]|nr:N-acetylgalactosamine-6-sulfatase [Opitutaceae bacterium]
MKRMNLNLAIAGVILSCLALQAAERPNILVFLVDDMGMMDTSVPFMADDDGRPERHPLNELYRTPNMERLARQGIRFNQFYANSVCSPSRVSIIRGQSSARHRVTQFIRPETNNAGDFGPQDWQWEGIAPGVVTLPAILRHQGYRTIHSGKAHFGPVGSFGELPQNFGFDVNIAGCAYGQPGSYYGEDHFGYAKKGRERRAVPGLQKYHGQDIHLSEALTLEINEAIRDAVEDKEPFFAYMSHYAVHTPFQPDERFAANYEHLDLKPNAKAFATLIEGMDKSLGDILDQLERLGVAENTLVFFLGDNGTDAPLGDSHAIACAAPLRGKKATHYEGGLRVPFIAAWAKLDEASDLQKALRIPADRLSDQVGTVHDIFPTILGVSGIETKEMVDGADLSPALEGGTLDRMPEFLMHFPHQHRSSYFTSYRLGDWKVIYHYHNEGPERYELYNLADDRSESNNLAGSRKGELQRMMRGMIEALSEAGAQFPLALDGSGRTLKPEMP